MGEPSSAASKEKLVAESSHKRDANFDESESSTKKSRTEAGHEKLKPLANQRIGPGSLVHCQNGDSSELQTTSQVAVGSIIRAEAAEDKGSRHTMEDAWVVLSDASLNSPGMLRCAHFAIYDGHGGRLAAGYAQKHLHANVLSAGLPRGALLNPIGGSALVARSGEMDMEALSKLKFICGGHLLLVRDALRHFGLHLVTTLGLVHRVEFSDNWPRGMHYLNVKTAKKAILDGFRKTDESLLQESAAGGWQDGATAVCVWLLGKTVFVANIGDAKAVVARSSTSEGLQNSSGEVSLLKAIVLTREHKAIYPQERARIQKAGGLVSSNGRLQGRLEVSRAFGDRQFKKVGVVATPDIHSFDLTERDHFIILGCDGLWGVFGPSDAVEFVNKLLKEGLPVATVSRRLVREAVRERRCKDNCTAIVIVFRNN